MCETQLSGWAGDRWRLPEAESRLSVLSYLILQSGQRYVVPPTDSRTCTLGKGNAYDAGNISSTTVPPPTTHNGDRQFVFMATAEQLLFSSAPSGILVFWDIKRRSQP